MDTNTSTNVKKTMCHACHKREAVTTCGDCHKQFCKECCGSFVDGPGYVQCDDCYDYMQELQDGSIYTAEDLAADMRIGMLSDIEANDELYAWL